MLTLATACNYSISTTQPVTTDWDSATDDESGIGL